MSRIDEVTTFAVAVGRAVDGVATPNTLRSALRVRLAGIGTPPVRNDGVWARTWSHDGFVVVADAGTIPLDHPSSSAPSPKHLAGAFDLHLVLAADGYDDLAVTLACNHDAIPLRPAAFPLAPRPIALRGRVLIAGIVPQPLAGATVSLTASSPAVPLPPPVTTDADGAYAFVSVPATRSLTISAAGGGHSGTQTISPPYHASVLTVNFALA